MFKSDDKNHTFHEPIVSMITIINNTQIKSKQNSETYRKIIKETLTITHNIDTLEDDLMAKQDDD